MKRLILSAAVLAATGAAAMASDSCNVPSDQWQPREALQQKLEQLGWQVRSIETDDGCYEAYAIDAQGQRVEAYFDPATLEQVGADDED
ncbi:MAG: PepSY domain-containing protein [Rhodospirillaceae bacterium]|nr:PepSY domain-containing protein [Rhodospirillaceae bacterium]